MIPIHELRFGNWVQDSRTNEFYQTEHLGVDYTSSLLNPIPLSPDILEKCGFEYCEFGYKFKDKWRLIIEWHQGWFLNKYPDMDFRISHEIKYVHQLQNLFFSIIGDELNINL